MSTLAIAMLAATTATTTDGISPRIMLLLIGSAIAGLVGGRLGFILYDGAHHQKFAAGVITGFIAFAGAYSFLDGLVPTASSCAPMNTSPPRQVSVQ